MKQPNHDEGVKVTNVNSVLQRSLVAPSIVLAMIGVGVLTACTSSRAGELDSGATAGSKQATEIVLRPDVEFGALNPARGPQGPKAGTLWGDRNGTAATGFLFRPADGFESPPHIHNVSYRGVVIHGLVHNDDPNADEQWMPSGSYWTQPKGAVHITSAIGTDTLAYIEIEEGPYLVRPVEEEFQTDERPVNVDPTNIVWLHASDLAWGDPLGAPGDTMESKVAFLWGEPDSGEPFGALIKLPEGFVGSIDTAGSTFRGVVIRGEPQVSSPDRPNALAMEPGSFLSTVGRSRLDVESSSSQGSVFYVRTDGRFEVRAKQTE